MPQSKSNMTKSKNSYKNQDKNQNKINNLSRRVSGGDRSRRPNSIVKGTNVGNPAFFQALTDPFNPESLGCQVPDPFPFPTETFHVHQTTVLGPNAGFSSLGVLLLPSPVVSMVDLTRVNNLATLGKRCVQNTSMTQIAASATLPSDACYGAVTQASVETIFSTWRVVSWGVKISNLQPELSATGRYFVSYFPCGDTMPTPIDISVATTSGIITPMVSCNPLSLESSVILETPTAFEFTVGDLMRGDIQLAGMYTNSNFWTFKSSVADGKAGVRTVGDELSVINATGVSTASYKDISRCVGGCGIVIYAEGLSAGVQANLQIETIYHLEGTPNFSGQANNILVPSVGKKANIGTSNTVDMVMIAASHISNSVKFLKEGAQFLNENRAGIAAIGQQGRQFVNSLLL